ncbi:MAG: T9SS type A sorting domain-containing protein [Ignavibacteria bacterium]|nr:T9SS type A sorting domain-containing protein [Ignavibacteria bacterium]
MNKTFLQFSLAFILVFALSMNSFAQLSTPEVESIYGGRINCISTYAKTSDTTRIFISTESANSLFYADVYSGSGTTTFSDFTVMPGLNASANYGSAIQKIAADSASGYIFFIHQTGLLSSHPSSSTVNTVSSGNINSLLVYRSYMFFIKNSTQFHYGTISTSGIYTESGSVTIASLSNPTICINKTNNRIYAFSEGTSPKLYKSSTDYNAFTGATTFSSISLATLSASLTWKAFGIGPDGKLFVGGASSGKSVANSTDDGTSWTTVNTGITGTHGPNIVYGGTASSYYVYFASCYSTDMGSTWVNFGNTGLETHSNDGTNIVDPNKSTLVYLTSDQGIAASTNSGATIFEIDNGVEAVQVNDCDMNTSNTNAWIASKSGIRKVYDYKTSPVWSNAMFPNGDGSPYYSADMNINDTSTAYVGNVRVYKTTNNGTAWNRVFTAEDAPYNFASSSSVDAIEVCPYNSNIVFAGYSQTSTNKGGLFYTTNAGTNWNQILLEAGSTGQDVDVNDIVFTIEGTDTVAYVGVSYDLSSPQGVALYRLTKSGNTWTPAQNMDGTHTTVGYQIVATIIDLSVSVTGDTVYACGTDAGVNHPIAYYKIVSGTNKWSAFSVTGFPITPGMTGKALSLGPDTVFVAADNIVYYLTGDYASATWHTGYTYPVGTQINMLYYDELLVGTGTGLLKQRGTGFLPVELSAFSSSISGSNVTLNWKTQTEINNAGYDIERKSLSNDWTKISFVQGSGTTNHEISYSYQDVNLATGTYSYRLKQIDYNGTSKYYYLSSEVIIGIPGKFSLAQNYPNPFNPVTKINFELPFNTNVTLAVFDVTGRMINELISGKLYTAGYHTIEFNGQNLSSGVYFYKLTTNENNSIRKMVLVK